jgi:hypothetical protein
MLFLDRLNQMILMLLVVIIRKYKILFLLFILTPISMYSNIEFRDTFEDNPGWKPWFINASGNGIWDRVTEDAGNEFASQSHGLKSLWIKDPDDNSYLHASKIFGEVSSEYMLEFYVLIPDNHVRIDSFPLCVLHNSTRNRNTDISLFITSLNFRLEIYVADSSGFLSNVAYIDSLNRWYKIQIYRHRTGNRAFVDFYLDGKLKGTYTPIHSRYVSDEIHLGSSAVHSRATGEIFYDDIIVSTPPNGEHPRLLFDRSDSNSLLRRTGGGATYLEVDYAHIWDSLRTYTDHFVGEPFSSIVWKKKYNNGNDSLFDAFSFPYPQFRFMPRKSFDHLDFWLGPQRRLASEVMALAFVAAVDETLINERDRAKEILMSLAHWQMWNDPHFRGWYGRKYIQLGVGHFMFSVALAYDWLYVYLSNYERMSVQNTLINLGISQAFLEACCGTGWGKNPRQWPNGTAVVMGGMGVSCLSLDGCDLNLELNVARTRIDALLNDDTTCNRSGAFAEGISYAGYAVDYLVTFCEADNSLIDYTRDGGFLTNYPTWRVWSMLPGAEDYYGNHFYPPAFWDITFCDYDIRGSKWTTAVARLADITQNPEARWFLKRRKDLNFSERNSLFDRWDVYLPFGLFLWTDESYDTMMPNPDTLLKIFMPAGWAIARTGWSDNDYVFALKSGPWFRNHNHHEQGSFIFGGQGRWLIADMGYATNNDQKRAVYHNVLFEENSEALYKCDHKLESRFTISGENRYSYLKTVGHSDKSNVSLWQRSIVFFNHLGGFVIMDYAEGNASVESVSWRLHTWIEPVVNERDNEIAISYPEGPNLRGLIVYPEDVLLSHQTVDRRISYREKGGLSKTYKFNRLSIDLPNDLDTLRVLAGFVPYSDQESMALETVSGLDFEGVIVENKKGAAAALFCKDDGREGGKYTLPVADSLFNVVANLLPNRQYRISIGKNSVPAMNYRIITSDVGTLNFTINGQGIWQVSIALAR